MKLDVFVRIPKDKSDSIEAIMIGPWVETMRGAFDDIDYARINGGFAAPFLGYELGLARRYSSSTSSDG
jgi:hypothetical protein